MTPELAARVDRVRRDLGDVCFACGRNNSVGMHLDLAHWDGNEVTGTFDPRAEYQGYGDVLHGGIAATALDEISVWAGILSEKVLSVTGKLELRYRKPLTTADEIAAIGRVTERRGRRLTIEASLEGPEGVAVTSTGLFLVQRDLDV